MHHLCLVVAFHAGSHAPSALRLVRVILVHADTALENYIEALRCVHSLILVGARLYFGNIFASLELGVGELLADHLHLVLAQVPHRFRLVAVLVLLDKLEVA